MKIAVIFIGGTIGSSNKNGWTGTDSATKYTLLNHFDYKKDGIEFSTSSPYTVLSENLSAKELNLLQIEIAEKLSMDYDGIIVTHGTDTLQYTASAIEYAFCDCKIPIVFVSAEYPLEDERTNGFANFEGAVEFIKSQSNSGVFVSYKNTNEENTNIHIATHILQHSECDANVYSIKGKPFATYNKSIMISNNEKLKSAKGIGVVNYVKNPEILTIDSCPGNSYSYCLDNVNAIILKPYHSFTLDTENIKFRDFCKRASDMNIPVFVTSGASKVRYESAKTFTELNIKPLPHCTYISAYMKIWAGISLEKDIADFMKKPIANEII